MGKKILLGISLLLFLSSIVRAQRWKYERYEFSFGLGISNFLGDLGGANQVGTHYFQDYEFSETKIATAIGIRYKLSRYFALKTHFTYGQVGGDDKLTKEFFRNYRNLNFTSDIWEWNMNFEGAFQEEQIGHRYNYRRVKGLRTYELYMYAFAGVGVFYFDPKTVVNGKTYDLHDLHTEGQGLPGTNANGLAYPNNYSLFQPCIPLGVGFKYTLDRKWGVNLELGIRKTFTDYIDDVSREYVDPKVLLANFGPISAALADRSNHSLPSVTAAGAERGDYRYKDSYMFAIFSLCYKIRNGRNNMPLF
jgi:hypothetical protein